VGGGDGFFSFFGAVPLYILLAVLHRICRGRAGDIRILSVEKDGLRGLRGRSILSRRERGGGGGVDAVMVFRQVEDRHASHENYRPIRKAILASAAAISVVWVRSYILHDYSIFAL